MEQLKNQRSSAAALWLRGATSGVLLGLLAPLLGATLPACGSDAADSTGGKRVVLHTRMRMAPEARDGFDTGLGWRVSLSRALIAAGPFYYFDGQPPLARSESAPGSRWAQAHHWLGLGTAHAHPGHYQAGNALGQMLESVSVDLLAGDTQLPDGDGVSGIYRSARFSFPDTARGAFSAELGASVALVEGTAEKSGEEPRRFRALASFADVSRSEADAQIEGCEFAENDVASDGTVTLSVHPEVWFNIVDFSLLAVDAGGAVVDFEAGTQPQIAFAQGLAQLSAYEFSFSP